MSGDFEPLRRLDLVIRPWATEKPNPLYRRSAFRASAYRTAALLARELRELGAKNIVLQLDLRDRDMRMDGFPRADARLGYPGVAFAFESKHGPLTYSTAVYSDVWDNIRAIALSLEALRAVDRFGVSKRGEQYAGWRQLTTGSDDTGLFTREQARIYLAERWGGDVRRALMETHPDRGGDPDEFRKVTRARELVGA